MIIQRGNRLFHSGPIPLPFSRSPYHGAGLYASGSTVDEYRVSLTASQAATLCSQVNRAVSEDLHLCPSCECSFVSMIVHVSAREVIAAAVSPQGMFCYTMLQKYLQAQSLVWVFVGGGILVNISLAVSCAVLVVAADLGIM